MVRNNGTRAHQGNDIIAPVGAAVTAADDGEVVFAGNNADHGNQVILAHRNGAGKVVSYTSYSHLKSIDVSVGMTVLGGDFVGSVGKTGNANSPGIPSHLHFEVRTTRYPGRGLNARVDPRPEFVP